MAIPSNYIDKITKEGDSRMICPAADKVRVENQNFESGDLDGALNELAGGKANKDETYTKEEVNEKVPLRIPATKNGDVITSTTDYGEIANAVKEDWRDAYVVVNNEAIFSFYQVEQNAIIFTRVDAEDGTQAYLAVSSNNVWSIEYSAISGGGEGTVTGVKVGETTYPPNTEGVVDISAPISNKVDKVTGKGLSTNDYTDADAAAVATIGSKANAADVYDKDTVDDMVAEAGKVKTVSVNGGTPAQPDTNGNVNLVIEAGAQGQKGDKGDTVVLDPQGLPQFTIVNDLTTGGEADALSAEMGRRLAMLSGTYAEAWAHAQAIPYVFPWLWVETVDGDAICKPIWHIGSGNFVDAAGSPISVVVTGSAGDPTISGTEGSTVPKDTVITITPASGCALHYSVDGGSTYKVADRAVNITLSTAGAKTIMAYCSNPNGSTTPVTRHITVQGTAVPTFAAKPNSGTTLTQKSGYIEVSRGGYVRISGTENGTLYYSTDGENYTEVQGNNYYDFQLADDDYETTAFVIYAKNKVGNDFSDPVTGTFKMAALQAPTLTPAGSEVASGSTVDITAPAGTIYYTTDGSDPTDQSTAYSSAIAITAGVTIKAIAKDTYGYSAVTSETYTIAVPKLKVKTRGATTMTLTKADDSTIALTLVDNSGNDSYNEFDLDEDLGGVTTFKSCAFGDNKKIVEIDFAGITLNTGEGLFNGADILERLEGLTVNGSWKNIISNTYRMKYAKISGQFTNAMAMCANCGNYYGKSAVLDLSGSSPNASSLWYQYAFGGFYMSADGSTGTLDLSSWDIVGFNNVGIFNDAKFNTLIVNNLRSRSSYDSNMFAGSTIAKVRLTSTQQPPLSGTRTDGGTYTDWVAQLLAANPNARIEVPSGSKATYVADSDWSQYENIIDEY